MLKRGIGSRFLGMTLNEHIEEQEQAIIERLDKRFTEIALILDEMSVSR